MQTTLKKQWRDGVFKNVLKSILVTRPLAQIIRRLDNLVTAHNSAGIFMRFNDADLFKTTSFENKNFTPEALGRKNGYILTDRACDPRLERMLGPIIRSLDYLSDAQIADSVFYVYFLCDSDALPSLKKIREKGGIYIPHLAFAVTEYRFIDRLAHTAMQRTWEKKERVSHLITETHENICEALSITGPLQGDYLEIGVYRGGSALTALHYMEEKTKASTALPGRKAWLLDTFDGFNYEQASRSPDAIWAGTHRLFGPEETMRYVGETLSSTTIPFQLIQNNICDDPLPSEITKVVVANIDVDMYEPTLAALKKVADLVVPGGIIICEDPSATPALYGAYQAMEEFLESDEGAAFTKIFKRGQYFLLKSAGFSITSNLRLADKNKRPRVERGLSF